MFLWRLAPGEDTVYLLTDPESRYMSPRRTRISVGHYYTEIIRRLDICSGYVLVAGGATPPVANRRRDLVN